ncbi:hypothetical protein JCM3765_007571 [Sporobolomyces pararoseus]
MPPLVIDPYISPYTPYLRYPLYYLTWLVYYLTYLLSPGLLTILQLLCLFLEHLLPRIEFWVENEMRGKLEKSTWAQESWKRGGKPFGELIKRDKPQWKRKEEGTVKVQEATGWILKLWRWIASWCGGRGRTQPQVSKPKESISLQKINKQSAPMTPKLQLSKPDALKLQRSPISKALVIQNRPPQPGVQHAGRLGSRWDQGGLAKVKGGGIGQSSSPNPTVGSDLLRQRQFQGAGGSGNSLLPFKSRPHQFHPDIDFEDLDDHEFDRGSVWSESGWKAAG